MFGRRGRALKVRGPEVWVIHMVGDAHDVHDKGGNITLSDCARSQVRERLVAWCINNEETANVIILKMSWT